MRKNTKINLRKIRKFFVLVLIFYFLYSIINKVRSEIDNRLRRGKCNDFNSMYESLYGRNDRT